jgi:hypothetical protein
MPNFPIPPTPPTPFQPPWKPAPFLFTNGISPWYWSRRLDQLLVQAVAGHPGHLLRVAEANKRKRAALLLLPSDGTATAFDIWAHARAEEVAIHYPPILSVMADLGLLEHAQHPDDRQNLAHTLTYRDFPRPGSRAMWATLVRGGVDLEAADFGGRTVLQRTAASNNTRLMLVLFDLGASPAALGWHAQDVAAFRAAMEAQS